MNQRIQELSKQASDYVNEVYTAPVRSKTPGKIWEDGHISWHTQFNQKFAELIVRECAGVAEGLSKLYPEKVGFDVGYTMGTARAAKEIKERFGVEE